LARRGYAVTGIDVADDWLEKAAADARSQGLDIHFRRLRGSELTARGDYDFVLAFNLTLGFMSDAELREHLRRTKDALAPGGKFLLVMAGPRLVPGQEQPSARNWEQRGRKFILTEKRIDGGYRIEDSLLIDLDAASVTEFHERQRAFSLDDVLTTLTGAGAWQIAAYRDLDGNPASATQFGVFICRK
jgi:SAM-dependent methyltransferase